MFLIIKAGFAVYKMCRKLKFSPSLKAAEHLGKTQPSLPPLLMRKLSFDTGGEDSAAAAMKPAASPDTMPGEIFQLENIVEEPVGKQQKNSVLAVKGL
jgi:hypothetical protein